MARPDRASRGRGHGGQRELTPVRDERPIDEVTSVLVAAVRRLGEAGEPEAASRLAARAFVALRHDEPRLAERINGVMHHLARLESVSPGAETDRPATR